MINNTELHSRKTYPTRVVGWVWGLLPLVNEEYGYGKGGSLDKWSTFMMGFPYLNYWRVAIDGHQIPPRYTLRYSKSSRQRVGKTWKTHQRCRWCAHPFLFTAGCGFLAWSQLTDIRGMSWNHGGQWLVVAGPFKSLPYWIRLTSAHGSWTLQHCSV